MSQNHDRDSRGMLDVAFELYKKCKAQPVCRGCACYVMSEDADSWSCSALEPRYWKLPKQRQVEVDTGSTPWPDIQVELVIARDLSQFPRRGRQRERGILDAKLAAIIEGVATHGSLNKAAQSLGISYSHAFSLVAETERNLGFPLTNGAVGRGSTLTPEAVKLLAAYKKTAMESKALLERSYREEMGSATC